MSEKNTLSECPERLAWINYILDCCRFYSAAEPREYKHAEFPFSSTSILPVEWFKSNSGNIWWTRSLLENELDHIYFDLSIILKLCSQAKFFMPLMFEDNIILGGQSNQFSDNYLPPNYLGHNLLIHNGVIDISGRMQAISVVAIDGFFRFLNYRRQYLIKRPQVSFIPSDGQVVLDCGACIGDMSVIFAALVGDKGEVHTFDPVPLHSRYMDKQISLNPEIGKRIKPNTMAVGRETQKINGNIKDVPQVSPGGCAVNDFYMTSLDDYCENNHLAKVDYIKFDVEGSEEDALLGARATITKHHPKIALSIYHKPDDIWRLPAVLRSIDPSYKFSYCHHSPVNWESVLYAY